MGLVASYSFTRIVGRTGDTRRGMPAHEAKQHTQMADTVEQPPTRRKHAHEHLGRREPKMTADQDRTTFAQPDTLLNICTPGMIESTTQDNNQAQPGSPKVAVQQFPNLSSIK